MHMKMMGLKMSSETQTRIRRLTGSAAGACAAGFLATFFVATPAEARVIDVNLFGERIPGTTGGCTLREAVQAVNGPSTIQGCGGPPDQQEEIIRLLSGTYVVRLASLSDTLTLTRPATFYGKGVDVTTITDDANGATHLFKIAQGGFAHFQGVRIDGIGFGQALTVDAGGSASAANAIISNSGHESSSTAGCILNQGTLTLDRVEVSGCRGWTAGSIANLGTMFILRSSVLATVHAARNGAIVNQGASARLTITNSTIAKNVSANHAVALYNLAGARADLSSVTVLYNSSETSSSLPVLKNDIGGVLTIKNTLIDNPGSPNCSGPITSRGYNHLGFSNGASTACAPVVRQATDISDVSYQVDKDAQNLPLRAGGVARVYVPSAVFGNGISAVIPQANCELEDQRGMSRRDGSNCEIGAANRGHATLVVGNAATPASEDIGMANQLAALGFDIFFQDDDWDAPFFGNIGLTVAVISTSVSDTTVGSKYRSVPIGVVVNKISALDNMRMVASNALGTFTTARSLFLTEASDSFHLRMGNWGATFINQGGGGWGTPTSAAERLAIYNFNSQPAIFRYGKQTMGDSNFMMPAGRISFPGWPSFFTGSGTVDGQRMFTEAVLWASRNR
jgi:hypothetical protein